MTQPIFARTRHVYDSYSDFWRLVELSGFPTCFVDEMDLQAEHTYIVVPVNGELRPHITHRRTLGPQRARIIWWNLERPDAPLDFGGLRSADVGYDKVIDEILEYVDEVWVSDEYYAALDRRMRFVPMGSHPDLCAGPRLPTTYDVALMAAPVPRRDGVVHELKKAGLRVAPNAWGEERDRILRSTAVMLSVHQHENPLPIGEPLRFALAAAYRMVLLSEWIEKPWPLTPTDDFVRARLPALVETARALSSNPWSRVLDTNLHSTLCVQYTFRRCVENAMRNPKNA